MKLQTLKPRVQVLGNRLATVHPGSSKRKGQGLYSYRWKQARLRFLRAHPLCECPDCAGKLVTPSEVVDHRVPHRGDLEKFWDVSNWTAMAKACHDAKTAREDGGFGNPQSTKALRPKVATGLDGYPK